jgi:WD40 repeat protein
VILGDSAGVISSFDVAMGVSTFDVNSNFNSIVTGGRDYVVRVWDKYVTSRPCAELDGHQAPVCALTLAVGPSRPPMFDTAASPHDLDGHQARVISVSLDNVLKVWDVATQTCLQTMWLHNLPGSHPPLAIRLHRERGALFVGSSTLLAFRMLRMEAESVDHLKSHNAPVSGARYNPLFGQVVTACRGSVVNVWNLKTGEQMVQFREAHGEAEISTLCFDRSGRRLLTGASDGSVKVWNFNIGLSLRKLQNAERTEVCGMVELKSGAIVTTGWWKDVSFFRVCEESQYLTLPERSTRGVGHNEDIQCVEECYGNNVATCSFDGTIIIWQVEKLAIKRKVEISTSIAHPGAPSATEKLLFLGKRARLRAGSLVSSGAGGWIRFWNLYSGCLVGAFQVTSGLATESVVSLATTESNEILATGNSSGTVHIWKIADFCCKPRKGVSMKIPPLLMSWSAHNASIVSLQIIDQVVPTGASKSSGDPTERTVRLLLSASADKTVKLWSITGDLVGFFGQYASWDLGDSATWTSIESQIVAPHFAQASG